jgi:hypothetical protein
LMRVEVERRILRAGAGLSIAVANFSGGKSRKEKKQSCSRLVREAIQGLSIHDGLLHSCSLLKERGPRPNIRIL